MGMLNVLLFKTKQQCQERRDARKIKNQSELEYESLKHKADLEAEALIRIRNEKDPDKKIKMQSRLNNGITDFSDL